MAISDNLGTQPSQAPRQDTKAEPELGASAEALLDYIYPAAGGFFLLLVWEIGTRVFSVPAFLLPPPSKVFATMVEYADILLMHSLTTLWEIVLGLVVSALVGVPLAVLIVYSRPFERVLYPLLVFSQTIPKIALAPLFVVWFGYALVPKVIMAFLVSFFPIVIDTVVGLKSVPEEMVDLSRSMGFGRLESFAKIMFPHALPNVFGGLKVAATLSVVGAVVGEFVGAQRGLGYLLVLSGGNLETALVFAAIVVLAIIGIALFMLIELIERLTIPWHTSIRRGEDRAMASL
jgi:NitT/TauT family transport system permease protein